MRNIIITPTEVSFRVSVEFDYTIEPISGDPDNPLLLADMEKHEIYMQIRDMPNVALDTLKISVDPIE